MNIINNNVNSIREELGKDGYSKEEEYFYRLNRKLIDKKRIELNLKRAEQKEKSIKAQHWMKCPKCGNQLKEISFSGIYADQCTVCHGIYFDHEEFETLLEAKMPKNYLKFLLKRLRSKMGEFDTEWRP